jgi:hypothetical protein
LVLYLAAALALGFPIYVWAMQLTPVGVVMAAALACLYFVVATIPLISLYLARVYKNIVHRPVFVIDRTRTCL